MRTAGEESYRTFQQMAIETNEEIVKSCGHTRTRSKSYRTWKTNARYSTPPDTHGHQEKLRPALSVAHRRIKNICVLAKERTRRTDDHGGHNVDNDK